MYIFDVHVRGANVLGFNELALHKRLNRDFGFNYFAKE
jgi:hypothetical protein